MCAPSGTIKHAFITQATEETRDSRHPCRAARGTGGVYRFGTRSKRKKGCIFMSLLPNDGARRLGGGCATAAQSLLLRRNGDPRIVRRDGTCKSYTGSVLSSVARNARDPRSGPIPAAIEEGSLASPWLCDHPVLSCASSPPPPPPFPSSCVESHDPTMRPPRILREELYAHPPASADLSRRPAQSRKAEPMTNGGQGKRVRSGTARTASQFYLLSLSLIFPLAC